MAKLIDHRIPIEIDVRMYDIFGMPITKRLHLTHEMHHLMTAKKEILGSMVESAIKDVYEFDD